MFEPYGLRARRNIEYDGIDVGADLIIYEVVRPFSPDHPEVRNVLPVAVQIKRTQDPSDLLRGLNQARAGQPHAKLHACVWADSRKRNTRLECVWVWAHAPKLSRTGDFPALAAEIATLKQIK